MPEFSSVDETQAVVAVLVVEVVTADVEDLDTEGEVFACCFCGGVLLE